MWQTVFTALPKRNQRRGQPHANQPKDLFNIRPQISVPPIARCSSWTRTVVFLAGIFKIALASVGVTIGPTWPELFGRWTPFLFLLFLISVGYVTYVWWKQ